MCRVQGEVEGLEGRLRGLGNARYRKRRRCKF